MADENKTVLLRVELDIAQLKKTSTEASEQLDKLKVKQSILKSQNQQGTVEFAKLGAEIKKYQKTLSDNAKALEINERLNKKNSGSMNDLKDEMLAGKIALGQMSEEMRKSDAGQKLIKDIDALNTTLKGTEESYGVYSRSVGNYAGTLAEVKARLKEIKGEMVGLDAGSERYQQLSEDAGILGDKIKEVNENVKASSGGTGFEKLGNNIGLIKGDLENLDFEGVSEKMSQMAQISSKMTFKEAIGGLKNMGSSLLSLGKAILLNPIFLVAGTILAIGGALKMWNDSVKNEAIATQKAHTKAIEDNIKMIEKQSGRAREISDLFIRRAELEGRSLADIGKMKLKALEEENQLERKQIDEHQRAVESLRRESRNATTEEDRQAIKDKIQEHRQSEDDLQNSLLWYSAKRKNLELEINNEILEDQKATNEKRKAEQQKAYEDRLAIERAISDKAFENINLSNENEEKRIEAKYKFLVDTAGDNIAELLLLENEKNKELEALDVKFKEEERNRVSETYRREIEDAKGKKDLIAQLKKNEVLELESIDLDFQAKSDDRALSYNAKVREIEKQRVDNAKKTASEIELIDAQINLAKAKGTENEFSAWANVQFAKVRLLETVSNLELENANLTSDEKIKIAKETELEIQGIQNESFEANKETTTSQNEWTKEQKKDLMLASINTAQQLSDILFQISNNQIQQELNDEEAKYNSKSEFLQNQLDNALITQAEFDAKKSALDSQHDAKEKALKEEQFKRNKASQIINATIAAAVGVVNALAAPPPLSFVMAGLAGVLGGAQIALIASQPTPTFAKGGIAKEGKFGGNSHSNGGTKGYFEDGTQVEVEKDEKFIVINKRSSGMLSALSDLNQRGGGVPFMQRGGVLKFASGGAIMTQASSGAESSLKFQSRIIEIISAMPNPVVDVQEIVDVNQNRVAVINRANF